MAYPHLPGEILDMVCTQLLHQRDLDSLFNCICSGKRLASIAVTKLYLIRHLAPEPPTGEPRTRIRRRSRGFWRSIILSSLGKTMYPYSQYLRTLDLDELAGVCRSEDLFQGELAQFKVDQQRGDRHELEWETANRIEEAITKQTPLLEELIGRFGGTLSRWIPQLPRLKNIELNSDEDIECMGTLIRLHCPSFKGLRMRMSEWNSQNPDHDIAELLNNLRPQSLESFTGLRLWEFTDDHPLGPSFRSLSFQALSCHAETLVELELPQLLLSTIPSLLLLKGCTNLVSLSLTGEELDESDDPLGNCLFSADLETLHNTMFLDLLSWLKECKRLRILHFADIFSAPALMASIFSENSIHLTSLHYKLCVMRDTKKFHQSLANQTSLQSLRLIDWTYPDCVEADAEVLAEALSKLVNLKSLYVSKEYAFPFVDRHIKQLARSLPKLEVWSTGGYSFSDAIWDEVASLRSLRSLDLRAVTSFTADGILDFIKKLGPGNKHLFLAVFNLDFATDLSQVEKGLIQEMIAKKFKGRFKFECGAPWTHDVDDLGEYEEWVKYS